MARAKLPREVLNELKWREGMGLAEAEVWVLDRARAEGYAVIPGTELRNLGRSFFETDRAAIPYHRVLLITFRGREVYRRPGAEVPR